MNNKMRVAGILRELHKDARQDYKRIGKGMLKSIFRPLRPADFEYAYLPISEAQGETLRSLILEHQCRQVVEFGTSFGISTIYLADAVRETGGKVVTTELLASKAKRAWQNIEAAALTPYVELRVGDAMETLKGETTPIDFLFLDGWKDLYLPLFRMLEHRFHDKTIIYADNMDMPSTQAYADYLRERSQKYATYKLAQGKALLTKVA